MVTFQPARLLHGKLDISLPSLDELLYSCAHVHAACSQLVITDDLPEWNIREAAIARDFQLRPGQQPPAPRRPPRAHLKPYTGTYGRPIG